MTVLEIVGEPFIAYRLVRSRAELEDRVADLLQRVRLDPNYMKRYPHAFSGGQRQRIAIARALALNPEFVVADEPVSALDVSVQAQILELLRDLRDAYSLTYLFIAHNLAVVEYISDRVGVMYVGRIAELGRNRDVFSQPRHPYTEALLSAIPKLDVEGEQKRRVVLQGDVADPSNPPSGCYFHPRCRYAQPICSKETPALEPVAGTMDDAHISACHFRDDLQLVGISREEERRVYRVPGIDHG
jgi:peptide/nickel transport system ATP-binding protein